MEKEQRKTSLGSREEAGHQTALFARDEAIDRDLRLLAGDWDRCQALSLKFCIPIL